jgi:hypothetical protein
MIVYFHPDTIRSSWAFWALARALRRLGHRVLDAPVPTDWNGCVVGTPPENAPTLDELREATVLVLAPEYVDSALLRHYGLAWLGVRKRAFFVESTHRPDVWCLNWTSRYHYDRCFWVDPMDVVQFAGGFHPMYVDTRTFYRADGVCKRIDAGFMGTLYSKRQTFLEGVRTPICARAVSAWTMFGEDQESWTRCYVKSLQAMKVGVDLPSNNPMATSRPFEIMACGIPCVTWAELPSDFVDGHDYIRYRTADELDVAVGGLLADKDWRERVAYNGWIKVQKHDSTDIWAQLLHLT